MGQLKGISMRAVNKYEGTRLKKAANPPGEEKSFLEKLKSLLTREKEPPREAPMTMMKTKAPFIPPNTFLLSPAEVGSDFVGPQIPDQYVPESIVRLEDYLLDYPETYKNAVMAAAYKETGKRNPNEQRTTEESGYYSTAKNILDNFGRTLRPEYGTGEFMPDGNAIFDTTAVNRDLVRNPEALLDAVYGDKFDNEGEGNKYRGRAYLQFTGKDLYRRLGRNKEIRQILGRRALEENPDLIMQPGVAERATVDYLERGQESQFRKLKRKGVVSSDDIDGLSQADANLLVVLQVSGGKYNDTTEAGLKKMDRETGVEREYTGLKSRIN